MVNDSIGDFLTRIRNAQYRKNEEVVIPLSKMVQAIAEILKEEGFVIDYKIDNQKPQGNIVVKLKYVDGQPAMSKLLRISRPGVRRYFGYRDIKNVMNGLGIGIYSTSKGIMTGQKAKKEKIGGEYLCEIW